MNIFICLWLKRQYENVKKFSIFLSRIVYLNLFSDFTKNWDQQMHSLIKKCKEKRTTGLFRIFSESKTCFQASKIQFYNVRFLRITKNSFLPKIIAFFGANIR